MARLTDITCSDTYSGAFGVGENGTICQARTSSIAKLVSLKIIEIQKTSLGGCFSNYLNTLINFMK